jgi:uncharacterized coiled-coil DUF342 family protein
MGEVTFETVIAGQRKVIRELRLKITEQGEEIADLASHEAALEEEVFTVTTERDENEARADELQYMVDDLEYQIEVVRGELFDAENAIEQMEGCQ